MAIYDLYNRRKQYAHFVRTSDYKQGIAYFQLELEQLQSQQVESVEKNETWGFIQRLRFVSGKTSEIREAIQQLAVFGLQQGDVDVLLANGFVAYAGSNYRQAYDSFIKGTNNAGNNQQHIGNYNLMRLHLLAAKCCWRWDDFPRAMAHLAVSAFHLRAYEKEMSDIPEDFRYQEYYRGRILSVYARLLTERRGAKRQYPESTFQAKDYLDEARTFFATDFVLERKDGSCVGHLFHVEILELEAISCRNMARSAINEKLLLDSLEESDRKIDLAHDVIDYEFGTTPSRRHAHLLRIRGVNLYHKVRWYGRRHLEYPERENDCLKSISLFTQEESLRVESFGVKNHATIARAFNNRAFAEILRAHGRLNYKNRNTSQALDILDNAERDLRFALTANGLAADLSLDKLRDLSLKTCLSKAQLLASCGHLMEVVLRRAEAGENFSRKTFKAIQSIFLLAVKTEDAYLQELSSVIAREDIGRRTHVIYEAMLEACSLYKAQVKVDKAAEKKLTTVIFEVFSRALAPHLWGQVNTLKNSIDGKPQSVAWPGKGASIRMLECLRKKEPFDEGIQNQKKLLDDFFQFLEDKSQEKFFKKNNSLPVSAYTENFTDNSGGLLAQFIGVRHAYILFFAGDVGKVAVSPRLIKILPQLPYKGVLDIQTDVLKLQSIYLELIEKENGADIDHKVTNFWKKPHPEVKEAEKILHLLYQIFIAPLNIDNIGINLNRFYIICDSWGWDIPWIALIKDFEPFIEFQSRAELNVTIDPTGNHWIKESLVSLHASLDMWRDIPRVYDRTPIEQGVRMVMGYTQQELKESSDFENILKEIYNALVQNPSDELWYVNNQSIPYFHNSSVSSIEQLLAEMSKANIIVLLGHSVNMENEHYHFGFCLKGDSKTDPDFVVLTQHDIQQCNLSNAKLVLLLTCKGGQGVRTTGNIPRSLFNAFLHAGVANIIYSNMPLHKEVAYAFGVSFLKRIRTQTLGQAYQDTILELINSQHPILSHHAKWSGISFIGNQNHKLFSVFNLD